MKRILLILLTLATLAACQSEDNSGTEQPVTAGEVAQSAQEAEMPSEAGRITGSVSYRERILLLPGSRLEVSLQDVSRADAAAGTIASLERADPGQVPIAFQLEYDPEKIDSRMSYALQARILAANGQLLFINDTATPVLTRGAGHHAEMWLVSAAGKAATTAEASGEDTPGMELEGQFSYFADAALFRDCSTGKRFPVEMSGQYLELERAYSNSGIEAGNPLKVNLKGRYLERPGMEENTREIMLVVDEFHQVSDVQDCVPQHHAELINTYWKLVEVDGKPVRTVPDRREAHMVLQAAEQRVNGNGGCNTFFGSYTLDGEKLSFTGVGSTMMACVSGMETEHAFLTSLGETNRAVVQGQFLQLYQDQRLVARFEAVYF